MVPVGEEVSDGRQSCVPEERNLAAYIGVEIFSREVPLGRECNKPGKEPRTDLFHNTERAGRGREAMKEPCTIREAGHRLFVAVNIKIKWPHF